MGKIDIFETDSDACITTTISELQRLYFIGRQEESEFERLRHYGKDVSIIDDRPVLIRGELL